MSTSETRHPRIDVEKIKALVVDRCYEAEHHRRIPTSHDAQLALVMDANTDQLEAVLHLFEGCDPNALPGLVDHCVDMVDAWDKVTRSGQLACPDSIGVVMEQLKLFLNDFQPGAPKGTETELEETDS